MKTLNIDFRTGPDESIEERLTSDHITFFEYDRETQKATDLPSSLFEAAPDLLAALELLINIINTPAFDGEQATENGIFLDDAINTAMQAIKKAKGDDNV